MDWNALEQTCMGCQRCALADGRHNVVFGVGSRDAEVMFVGEGPGENEDLQGEPFVGRAGKLLDDMLELIDLDRKKNVYIANIVKCRPPRNRDPQPLSPQPGGPAQTQDHRLPGPHRRHASDP